MRFLTLFWDHGIHGIVSVEITNHGLQKKRIPRHSQYRIHESRLSFFCIPGSRARFLPNPGSRRTPSRPCFIAVGIFWRKPPRCEISYNYNRAVCSLFASLLPTSKLASLAVMKTDFTFCFAFCLFFFFKERMTLLYSLYDALSQLSISPGVFHDVLFCEVIQAGVCRLLSIYCSRHGQFIKEVISPIE